MDLMEFQAKKLFAKHDVPVTEGIVAQTPEEARAAAEKLGVVVVKAQVKAGGRGKAGGVKLAKTPDEAFEHASNILGMTIKDLTVHRVLIAPAASIEEEYYFSFLLDRANRSYLCIASVEGGVEIEEVAKTNPDAVKQIAIDPGTGVDEAKAREIVAEAGFPEVLTDQAVQTVLGLWKTYALYMTNDYELSSFTKEGLIYTPAQLQVKPKVDQDVEIQIDEKGANHG